MRICVTAEGTSLDSKVDPRFGRAANFIIYDTDTKEYNVVENKQRMDLPQGAGIQSATTIVDAEANVVLTGNCGPKSFRVLESCQIPVYVGFGQGTVQEAIDKFLAGGIEPVSQANVDAHWM